MKLMKKVFTLVALAILGISTIGCGEHKAAAPPPKAAETPGPTGGDKGAETPAPPTDAAKEGEAK
jgi:hypothetical protein